MKWSCVRIRLGRNPGANGCFFCQLPFKCYLTEVASLGDWLEICPWVASRVVNKQGFSSWSLEVLYCDAKGSRAFLRIFSTERRGVCLVWTLSKPGGDTPHPTPQTVIPNPERGRQSAPPSAPRAPWPTRTPRYRSYCVANVQ